MAPVSPTHAFDPTPAYEQNKENFSPFDCEEEPMSHYTGASKPTREVRFSNFPSVDVPARRAQSVATHHHIPLLEPISSASHLPRQSVALRNDGRGDDMQKYMEHARSVIERQREAFKQEKALFEQERNMWNAERSVLQARILNLEARLNQMKDGTDGKRRYSNESSAVAGARSFRADLGSFSSINSVHTSRTTSQTHTSPPVWEGPELTKPVTRVFSNEDQHRKSNGALPSISENDDMAELSKEISPTTVLPVKSVPIHEVDPKLDGITIRSSALVPSFRALTPTYIRSPSQSPSPRGKLPDLPDHALQLDTNNLLSPFDEKLKRHAGHTPMNLGIESANGSSVITTEQQTPRREDPPPPVSTTRPPVRPSEHADGYFSFSGDAPDELQMARAMMLTQDHNDTEEAIFDPTPDDDKPLTGPLMLDPGNKTNTSHVFLDRLDQKLHEVEETQKTETTPHSASASHSEKDYEGPRLKMKNSMNFGSAFGSLKPGCL